MRQSSLTEVALTTCLPCWARRRNIITWRLPTSQLRLSLEISDDKLEEKCGKGIDKRGALRFTRPQMLGMQHFIAVAVRSFDTLKYSRTS